MKLRQFAELKAKNYAELRAVCEAKGIPTTVAGTRTPKSIEELIIDLLEMRDQ